MNRKIRAVDFDGTLCENKWPDIGAPNIKLINHLIQKQKDGDIIILWTCRRDEKLTNAIRFCSEYGLTFNYINENAKETLEWMDGDSRKIFANEYYDDRSNHNFKLPFVSEYFDPEKVQKIEHALAITLTDWQIEYLNKKEARSKCIGGRASGNQLIYAIWLLLGPMDEFDDHDKAIVVRLLSKRCDSDMAFNSWFDLFIHDIDNCLKKAGFETNNKEEGVILC